MMCPDGPALTIDGLAVDVYDGSPMYFSHDKELSQGHRYKEEARRQAFQLRADRYCRQVALAALLVDLEKVCSLSPDGVLHGPCAAAPRWGREAQRSRHFQQLCARRRRSQNTSEPAAAAVADTLCCWLLPAEENAVVVADAAGTVHSTAARRPVTCTRASLTQRLRLFHRKKQLRRPSSADFPVACVDPNGFVSWILPTPPTTPVHTSTPMPLHPPVCRIDLEGHVHDVAGLKPPQSPADIHAWERLKLFHRKRHSRWQAEATGHVNHAEDDWDDVYVNHSGTATPIDLGPEVPFARTCSMDSEGVLHCSESHRLERTCSIDSEGVVHGLKELGNLQPPCLASRLKLFHRKKHQRDLKATEYPFPQDEEHHSRIIVSLDPDGRIQGWQEYEEEPLIVPVM